jgi:thiol-disulfide isomerase/thioredoxin
MFIPTACALFVSLLSISSSALGLVQSDIPLSPNGYSFGRGSPSSNVVVDLYIDLTCSACLDSWPVLQEVAQAYDRSVNFRYRLLPLPYHQQAFILSKAANCVQYYNPGVAVFNFMDVAYANQAQIYTSTTANMTYNQVVDLVGAWAQSAGGISASQYAEGMNSSTSAGNTIEMNARYMFKFSALAEVYGTPMYAINGVRTSGLDSVDAWKRTLSPLIAS